MRRQRVLIMAEKREHSSASDSHSCSSKLVCPVSIVSLLICTAALIRVEIINQRVHSVEDLLTEGREIQELVKVSSDAPSLEHSEGNDFLLLNTIRNKAFGSPGREVSVGGTPVHV